MNCLTIDSYVYIYIGSDKVMLYNTYNQAMIESSSITVIKLIEKIECFDNLRVVIIDTKDLSDPSICDFISKVRGGFFGDLIPNSSGQKAIQMQPILKVHLDYKILRKDKERSVKENILHYIYNVWLYIGSECSYDCSFCGDIFKQFPYCTKSNSKSVIDKNVLQYLSGKLSSISGINFNLCGGNLLNNPLLIDAIRIFKPIDTLSILVHYNHAIGNPELFLDLVKRNISINLLMPPDPTLIDWSKFKRVVVESDNIKIFIPVVSEEKYELYSSAFNKVWNGELKLSPFYNGNNLQFFQDCLFLSESEILQQKHSLKDIETRRVINPGDFGNIYIDCNLDVRSNMCCDVLGNLHDESIESVVSKSFTQHGGWVDTRERFSDCRDCCFNALCPPVSASSRQIGSVRICKQLID